MRTNADAVKKILGQNYDSFANPDLIPYIETASAIVDQLIQQAAEDNQVIPTSTLELIERWLSAYFYTIMDPLYLTKKTGLAMGTFPERSYKDAAIQLDPTALLNDILSKNRATGYWGGTNNPTPWVDR